MATLTVQTLVRNGSFVGTFAAAAGGGDVFPNDGQTVVVVQNASGGSLNVTAAKAAASLDMGSKRGALPLSDLVVAVAPGAKVVMGPFAPDFFNNGSGQVALTYSGVTSLTVQPVSYANVA